MQFVVGVVVGAMFSTAVLGFVHPVLVGLLHATS